jgi:hypothetical protein
VEAVPATERSLPPPRTTPPSRRPSSPGRPPARRAQRLRRAPHPPPPPPRTAAMAAASVEQLVLDLADPATREAALLDLSKKREAFPELAPCLWHSFGTIAALLQVRAAQDGEDGAARGPCSSRERVIEPRGGRAGGGMGGRPRADAPRPTHPPSSLEGDRGHLPPPLPPRPHRARLQPRLQRAGAPAVRRVAPRHARAVSPSARAPLPLPISQHGVQDASV